MAEHNELGKKGEEIAQTYLSGQGYTIIATNWRFGNDEVDIIANEAGFCVFVEVKTRSTNVFGEPEESVTKQKQKFLIRAANIFVQQRKIEHEVRFDIISVLVSGTAYKVNHIKDAFYPTLR